METRENTLSERERFLLNALSNDPDETARRRAFVLLNWAEGKAPKVIGQELGVRSAQVNRLTRAFLKSRLEIFPSASLERALRGSAGEVSVNSLLTQSASELTHSRYVSELALELFDATSEVHHISGEWRRVLEVAARLHNLGGHADNDARHERVPHDTVLAHDLEGFSPQERDVIACLELFSRKKVKPDKDALFSGFDEDTKKITLGLASILRIADGLDFSKTQSTKIVTIVCGAVVEVQVSGEHSAQDMARASKKADVWNEMISPPLVIRTVDTSHPGEAPVARKRPPLAANDSMSHAARQILATQFEKLQSYETAIRADDNEDAIHDMRVACRRLNSAFRLFRAYMPKKVVNKLHPMIEPLRDLLGEIRNLDVLDANLKEYRAGVAAEEDEMLKAVSDAWRNQRSARQDDLVELLESAPYANWVRRFEHFVLEQDKGAGERNADVVPGLIWKEYGAVRAYEPRVAVASLEELHALRIDIKRLRYTLEFFRDAIFESSESSDGLIEPLVALQDYLGNMHDAVVAGEELTGFIADYAQRARQRGEVSPEFQALAAYHVHLQSRIVSLRAQLPEHWEIVLRVEYRRELAEATANL